MFYRALPDKTLPIKGQECRKGIEGTIEGTCDRWHSAAQRSTAQHSACCAVLRCAALCCAALRCAVLHAMQPGQIYTDFLVIATWYFIMHCTGSPPVHHRYTTGTPPVHHRYTTGNILIDVHRHLTSFFHTHDKFLPKV